MSTDDFELDEPQLTGDDILVVDDARSGSDSVALVTGAASGIGRATAAALTKNGPTVVGVDVDADEAGLDGTGDVVDVVEGTGEFVATPADTHRRRGHGCCRHGDSRRRVTVRREHRRDAHIASLSGFPMETYDRMLDLMLRSPFRTAKRTIPHIEETDDGVGAIANTSSVHGHYATQDKAAYITAKHGVHGLTKSIAAEGEGTLRGFPVSVGYVLTPLMVNQIEDTAEERGISVQEVVEDVTLGQARTKRMMEPAEVANLFTFGFSGHGTHLNGGDMLWDGGYTNTHE